MKSERHKGCLLPGDADQDGDCTQAQQHKDEEEIDTKDCRLGSPFALFHIVNLRCRVATSHVWMCTVYVLICLGSRRGAAECVWVLRYQSR